MYLKYYLVTFLILFSLYCLWMDVTLYMELQVMPPRPPDPSPDTVMSSSSSRTEEYMYSPFHPISVKLLMISAFKEFGEDPLAYALVRHSPLALIFSPNMMSLLGVFVAAISTKYFISEDLNKRRLGVLLFKVRDFIDSLDGAIAREVRNTHGEILVANPESFGWMVDGVCDGFADVFRFIAYIIFLHKVLERNGTRKGAGNGILSYSLLEGGEGSENSRGTSRSRLGHLWESYRRPVVVVAMIALQTLITSILWNYFMINYHRVLETDLYTGSIEGHTPSLVSQKQNEILKSNGFVLICFMWRLINPQIMNQAQFVAILLGKDVEFLQVIHILGWIPPLAVGVVSYSHLQIVRDGVRQASLGL